MENNDRATFLHELKRILTGFYQSVKSENYIGKERELVSRFAFDNLAKNAGCCHIFYNSAQISIETRVAQIPLENSIEKQKSQVCKDLIIWRKPNQNYWSENNIPLCIMEWKHNIQGPSEYDINWLMRYTKLYPSCFGIAINVETKFEYKFTATLIIDGNIIDKYWHVSNENECGK